MTEMLTITKKGLESYENKISELTKERDQLAAKCAEMREAATRQINGFDMDQYILHQFPATVGHTPIKIWFENLLRIANTDQCGQGYVSREKAKVLVEAFKKYADHKPNCSDVYGSGEEECNCGYIKTLGVIQNELS